MAMIRLSPASTTLSTAASTTAALLWWAAVRTAVAALCVGMLLGLAQLGIDRALAYYANITPYTGAG